MAGSAHADGHRSTRRAIVEILDASPRGMTAAELARGLGMHANGVRKQLNALVRDGAVGAEREVSGRPGRPAVRYHSAQEHRETIAARRLATLLVEFVREMEPDESQMEEFGRRQARRLATTADGRAALLGVLTTMGFAPRETTGARAAREGRLDVVLGHCPFAAAAAADGGRLVCVLHRGLSRGLVEMTPAGRLTDFDIRPPELAGCRIAAEGLRPLPVAGEAGPSSP